MLAYSDQFFINDCIRDLITEALSMRPAQRDFTVLKCLQFEHASCCHIHVQLYDIYTVGIMFVWLNYVCFVFAFGVNGEFSA